MTNCDIPGLEPTAESIIVTTVCGVDTPVAEDFPWFKVPYGGGWLSMCRKPRDHDGPHDANGDTA